MVLMWFACILQALFLFTGTYASTPAVLEKEINQLEEKLVRIRHNLHQAQEELLQTPHEICKIARLQRLKIYQKNVANAISGKRHHLTLHAIGQPPIKTTSPQESTKLEGITVKNKPAPTTLPKDGALAQKSAKNTAKKPAHKTDMESKTTKPTPVLKKPEPKASAISKPATPKPTKSGEKEALTKKSPPAPAKLTSSKKESEAKDNTPYYSHHIVNGSVTKPFGKRGKYLPHPMHQKDGVVFSCEPESVVYAPTDAEVVLVAPLYGRMACILKHHGDLYTAIYGIEYTLIVENDKVRAGQPIGRVQETSPAFLYVELRKNDQAQNIMYHLR